jgi:ribosome-associated protein
MTTSTTDKRVSEPLDVARCVVDVLVDGHGEDVLLLDIRGITLVADYFVIASADTERQTGALIEGVTMQCRERVGRRPLRVEGEPSDGWVLIDYGAVVVHLFAPEARSHYDLEGLWKEGRVVVRAQ